MNYIFIKRKILNISKIFCEEILEMEDEKTESYKVLDAYTYLLDVINSVAIYEDTSLDNDNASGLIYN